MYRFTLPLKVVTMSVIAQVLAMKEMQPQAWVMSPAVRSIREKVCISI